MNAAAKLLKHQFPHQEGLQSTLLASANKCQVLAGGAIQVLHVRSNHWICIHVNRNKSLVEVYDSKYTTIPMAAVDLILQLIQSDQDTVTINCKKMQEQSGNDACGTFAIAVATSLCYEDDPTSKVWKQDLMWQHILECFEIGQMTPFPLDIQMVKDYEELENDSKINSTSTYQIHCKCRQRYKPRDFMKSCTKCSKWYHAKCAGIPASSFLKQKLWTCSYCS